MDWLNVGVPATYFQHILPPDLLDAANCYGQQPLSKQQQPHRVGMRKIFDSAVHND
jgi:hypothetical protein